MSIQRLVVSVMTCAFVLTVMRATLAAARAQPAAPAAPRQTVDENTIRDLVAQLGDDDFGKRQAAEKRLIEIGQPALELVSKAAGASIDAEVRSRAARVVLEIEHLAFRAAVKDWGHLVDEGRACRFRVEADRLYIKIPPKAHVLSAEVGVTNAPRVLRDIAGDFRAEVTALGPIPGDANSLLNGRWPFYAAGLLVWQDERNYLRLDRARMYFIPAAKWRCYVGWELRQDGDVARASKWEDAPLDETKPASFRLERKGKTFTASYRQEGKEWKQLPPIDIEFTPKVGVGVAAIQNTPAGYEAILQGLKISPVKNAD